MSEMIPHPAIVYDLPLNDETVMLRPETVILRFPNGNTVDIGALCYLRRESPSLYGKRRPSVGRRVDLQSLSNERVAKVRKLITHISDDLRYSGRRVETISDRVKRFVAFMSWADKNGLHNTLNGVNEALFTIQSYSEYLREQVATNIISNNHGARQQLVICSFIGNFFAVDDLHRGINLLWVNHGSTEATIPPDEEAQARILALCEAIFDGLTTLVLDNKSYPYPMALPKYLEHKNNTLWLFPGTSWFRTPQMEAKRLAKGLPLGLFDYRNGKLFTQKEIQFRNEYANNMDCALRYKTSKAERQLEAANCNPQHVQRRRVAAQAQNAFILLFVAQTGMNWAQIVNLTWSDKFEVSPTHQAFRTIKWRADNREVFFELPVAFLPKFKRYLQLRKYMLNGAYSNLLFFKVKDNNIGKAEKIRSTLDLIYTVLWRIDPFLKKIMARQWRSAKSDWLINNTDPSTAALVLQNSEKTVLASYAAGSETVHLEEMTNFLENISKTVVDKGQEITGGVNLAIGACSEFGVPNQTSNAPVLSNCKGTEGCLFCDKFKIHADEVDVRKLISCRYCLYQTAPLAGNEEQRNVMLEPFFNRIDAILSEISQRDSTLVSRITREVEVEGELSPYWARKLEMLMDLGLVA